MSLGEQASLGHYDLSLAANINRLALGLGFPLPYPRLKINVIDTDETFGVLNSAEVINGPADLDDDITFVDEDANSSDSDDDSDDELGGFIDDDDDEGPDHSNDCPAHHVHGPSPRIEIVSNKRQNASTTLAALQGSSLAIKDFSTKEEHELFMALWNKHGQTSRLCRRNSTIWHLRLPKEIPMV